MIWASVVPDAITSAARTNDDRANAESRTRLFSNPEHAHDPRTRNPNRTGGYASKLTRVLVARPARSVFALSAPGVLLV